MAYGSHGDLVGELQEKLRRIDELKQKGDQRQAALTRMKDEIGAMSVTVSSPDRTVTVVAGPGGGVQSVRLSEEAMQGSAIQLSSTITTTIQEAVAAAARRQATIVQDALGGQSTVLEQVLQTQAEAFGTSVAALKATVEAERPVVPQRPIDQGADFTEEDFLAEQQPSRPSRPEVHRKPAEDDDFLDPFDEGERR
ncbi:YbaB/EbfC family nucleoid-associated protein [Amycolatopsis endophytica]|uniref:DNA-binding protein YbaB n=1 Tax=Amycolatopsis endophytica TaxID=860233 RepID=A0A853AYG5_9PSEU|nr:YbaB/EbfC family nucleoid-associated protein [Amycolatopsis endophytica]NYI87813.1 DNA-binding protein YbaB [Amycolatopsis endophytica]